MDTFLERAIKDGHAILSGEGKIVDELSRRRTEARRLHEEAERVWKNAKGKFEEALLGKTSTLFSRDIR